MNTTFPTIESQTFRGMGTDIELFLVVKNEDELKKSALDIAIARGMYIHYEKIFSRFDTESELSSINDSLNKAVEASEEMREVANKALFYHKKYEGLYDPRIITALEASGYSRDFQKQDFAPKGSLQSFDISHKLEEDLIVSGTTILFRQRMDFAGIVKGYVTDKVSHFLTSQGWSDFLVDSGGDIYASGKSADGDTWSIAVEGINDNRLAFMLSNCGVATSGISRRKWEYEGKRFHHIINPKQPENFLFDVKTISVIAASTEEADVLAKVLFLKNDTERKAMANEENIATLFLYYKGNAWLSPAAKQYCIQSQ